MRPRSSTPQQRRSQLLAGAAALLAFVTGLVLASIGDTGRSDDWVLVGLTLMLAAVQVAVGAALWRLFCRRMRPFEEAYIQGLEMGRDHGYREGRRTARPVVIPAICPHCGGQVLGQRSSTG